MLARSYLQFAMAACHRTHGLDAVHQKIHYNLLQLDAVAIDQWKRRRKVEPQRYTANVDFPTDQWDHVLNGFVDVELRSFERALLGQRPDARNHVARASCAADHLLDRAACLVNSRHLAAKPSKACIAIRDDAGERLIHFMGD